MLRKSHIRQFVVIRLTGILRVTNFWDLDSWKYLLLTKALPLKKRVIPLGRR